MSCVCYVCVLKHLGGEVTLSPRPSIDAGRAIKCFIQIIGNEKYFYTLIYVQVISHCARQISRRVPKSSRRARGRASAREFL